MEILYATLELGVPVAIVAWFLFHRLYAEGELDRAEGYRTVRSRLRDIKKSARNNPSRDFLRRRWMKFGGGFYGAAALWTFAIIEFTDLTGLIVDFPGIATLFADGVFSFFVDVFVNQIQNFVSALVWFTWWSDEEDSLLTWVLVAYAGYLVGLNAARFVPELPRYSLLPRARSDDDDREL